MTNQIEKLEKYAIEALHSERVSYAEGLAIRATLELARQQRQTNVMLDVANLSAAGIAYELCRIADHLVSGRESTRAFVDVSPDHELSEATKGPDWDSVPDAWSDDPTNCDHIETGEQPEIVSQTQDSRDSAEAPSIQ